MPNPTTTSQARLSTSAFLPNTLVGREVEIKRLACEVDPTVRTLPDILHAVLVNSSVIGFAADRINCVGWISGQVLVVGFDILDHTVLHRIKT